MNEPQASLVLAADDPAALARFYGALLQVEPQPGLSASHWRLPWPGGGTLELYAPSRQRRPPRQVGRLALCLQRRAAGAEPVAVLQAWLADGIALGATLQEPLRREPFGAEAWLADPEGNRLLLLVPVQAP
ncbi:MAG: VOC family protein [Cyanobium sp.]